MTSVAAITRPTLDTALNYLVCPKDGADILLDVPKVDIVTEGEFVCTLCDAKYEIEQGVPNFAGKVETYDWQEGIEDEEIEGKIRESADPALTQAQIRSLGNFLLIRYGFRRDQAIQKLNQIVNRVVQNDGLTEDQIRTVMGSASEARYDLEIYRNGLTIVDELLERAVADYDPKKGIIFEGGCATGAAIRKARDYFTAELFIGADISSNMVSEAQKRSTNRELFVRADVRSLPIRLGSVGLGIGQNIWDRVSNPPETVEELKRILNSEGAVILSQCDPPQYVSTDGKIVYVPEGKRLSLPEIISRLGFREREYQRIIWIPNTLQDGPENLPTDSYYASR